MEDMEAASEIDFVEDKTEEYIERIKLLQYILNNRLLLCEVQWMIFVAAACSPAPDFVMQKTGCDNISAVLNVIESIPPLEIMRQKIDNDDDLSTDMVNLLWSVLWSMDMPVVEGLHQKDIEQSMFDVDPNASMLLPTYAFQVLWKDCWVPMSREYYTGFAYCSLKVENIFSVVCQRNFSVQSNEAVVLRTDLKPCIEESPICTAWEKTCFGRSLTCCVGLVEYVKHPELVEFKETEGTPNCMDITVQDGKLVRLCCLLLYDRSCTRTENVDGIKSDAELLYKLD